MWRYHINHYTNKVNNHFSSYLMTLIKFIQYGGNSVAFIFFYQTFNQNKPNHKKVHPSGCFLIEEIIGFYLEIVFQNGIACGSDANYCF